MKIAVASGDGVSISRHFGRSKCFIVFDIAQGQIAGRETRDNSHTAHAKGQCEGQEGPHDHESHSHQDIINALRDCGVVLCGGMGQRAAKDLRANGIDACVMEGELTPEQAVRAFLDVDGNLGGGGPFCRCH